MSDAVKALTQMLNREKTAPKRLRALWALSVMDELDEEVLLTCTEDENDHMRSWAVRLLCEGKNPSEKALARFGKIAEEDSSGLVRLYLAAMLQRMPIPARFPIALRLAKHEEDADDRCQPLMIWYGIEPGVVRHRAEAVKLVGQTKIPKLRQLIARRLAEGK